MNDAFNQGRYGQSYGGGDWNEYQRGLNEKAAWDAHRAANAPSGGGYAAPATGGGGGGGGGGAGGGLLLLVVLVVAAAAASIGLAAAIGALFGAPVIMVATGLLQRGRPAAYGQAFAAAFWGLALALVSFTVLGFGVFLAEDVGRQSEPLFALWSALVFVHIETVRHLGLAPPVLPVGFNVSPTLLAVAVAALHGPGIILCALALRRHLGRVFAGFGGFLAALATALGTVLVGGLAGSVAARWAVEQAEPAVAWTDIDLGLLAIPALVVLAVQGLGGGLLLAAGLSLGSRRQGSARVRFADCYGAAILILVLHMLVLSALLFFYRWADPVAAVLRWARDWQPATVEALSAGLPGYLAFQAIASLAAAAFAVHWLKGPYRGYRGGLTALAVIALVALPTSTLVFYGILRLQG